MKDKPGNDAKTFNRPTDIAWDSQGNAYISDGYGDRRVVKLDKADNFVMTWGTQGDGPGQFRLLHTTAVDSKDRVYVKRGAASRHSASFTREVVFTNHRGHRAHREEIRLL